MGAADTGPEVPVTVRVAGDRVALGGDGPRAVLAASAARLALEHRLGRVKICPADDCRWASYDSSRDSRARGAR
ncbi:MAG TPA: hypothetical protein VFJ94_08100 [Intrasporangium sp.]|uniref:hypothetical protein n=1 Tax=Intrasporangium sp. TaxID=1925024 RepID=UPI002D796061|nr:hypothetical protein [Intrasporangium sp.]HET7398471.1 hypothetical protein [Intrasporangium sp.]